MSKLAKRVVDAVCITLGSAVFSLGLECFVLPNGLLLGGATGAATILYYFASLPVGIGVLALNAPLFVWSACKKGVRATAGTICATAWFSLCLTVGESVITFRFTDDRMLGALFGGLIMGVGLGIVYARDFVTGGTDVAAGLLGECFPAISFGQWIAVLDTLIILIGTLISRSLLTGLYSAVMVLIYSLVIEQFLSGRFRGKTVLIVTEQVSEVQQAVYHDIGRGCTRLDGFGGKDGKGKSVLLCAMRDAQLPQIRKILAKIDPSAFVMVLRATEIWGEGFFSL